MAINDTVELSVRGTVSGQAHVHTLHFRYNEVGSTDAGLVADFNANVLASYRAIFPAVDPCASLVTVRQVCGATPLRAPAEAVPGAVVGTRDSTGIGDNQPSWLATVVSERTALAGRRRRGRFFLGGLYEIDTALNTLQSGVNRHLTHTTAYVNALIARYVTAGGNPGGYALVVHSRTEAAIPGRQCQDSSTPVTGLLVRTLIGSMKSRKPGSGT